MMEIGPVTLEGQWVRLEPLAEKHLPDLFEAAQDDDIWRYFPTPRPRTMSEMQKWFETAENGRKDGVFLPFAIIEKASGKAIGSTRYMAISRPDYSVEIGSTGLGRAYWRTAINTECKYLLIKHAFEDLKCIRVWLKTDSRNLISQRAIARIGAKKEGVLRKQMILHDGYIRDTVVFSIIDDEWPEVKADLEQKLERTEVQKL
jgi:RimJ/RimL family protein N-acetyltransferase